MDSNYLVKDLYEAAFLYSSGKQLLRLDRERDYFWFVFKDKDVCEKESNNYWSGAALGNIKQYADAVKTLKERLFAQK